MEVVRLNGQRSEGSLSCKSNGPQGLVRNGQVLHGGLDQIKMLSLTRAAFVIREFSGYQNLNCHCGIVDEIFVVVAPTLLNKTK